MISPVWQVRSHRNPVANDCVAIAINEQHISASAMGAVPHKIDLTRIRAFDSTLLIFLIVRRAGRQAFQDRPTDSPSLAQFREKISTAHATCRVTAACGERAACAPRQYWLVAASVSSSARNRCASSRDVRTATAEHSARIPRNSGLASLHANASPGYLRRRAESAHSRNRKITQRLRAAPATSARWSCPAVLYGAIERRYCSDGYKAGEPRSRSPSHHQEFRAHRIGYAGCYYARPAGGRRTIRRGFSKEGIANRTEEFTGDENAKDSWRRVRLVI